MRFDRKRKLVLAFLLWLAGGSVVHAATVTIDFEELSLAAGTEFYNGADGTGGFTSQGTHFLNAFTPEFGSWSGWAYSRAVDTTTPSLSNQYSAWPSPGGGADDSEKYGIAFSGPDGGEGGMVPLITLPIGAEPVAVKVANSTYAALSMLNGDGFAKRFGGSTGNDPDWFRLTVLGLDDSQQTVGDVEFYLADYRFADSESDFVRTDWTNVDLTPLTGLEVRELQFRFHSSDVSPFGMNTPAYAAIDDLVLSAANALPGDYNGDGTVDAADYTVWLAALGQPVAQPGGGADGDASGVVDIGDYGVWKTHFGEGGVESRQVATPEPTNCVLACFTLLMVTGLSRFHRQKRKS